MMAAPLMWISESGRLRKPLEYCQLFGEIVHAQTGYAYLKAMSHQFYHMVQALGKSPNQLSPNFKSLWTVASEAFFTFIGPLLYLMRIYWKWRICSRLMWSLKGINGAGLGIRCEKMSLSGPTSYAMESSGWDKKRRDLVRPGDELWKGSARI